MKRFYVTALLFLFAASSLATAANPWTTFTPSADTRIIYVSNSLGNDALASSYAANGINDPFQPNSGVTPFKTIAAAATAYNALPDNEPHWILLKSGDTWTDENFGTWRKSGRSATEPALLASYGDSLQAPKVLTGSSSFSGAIQNNVNNVTIADISVRAHTYVRPAEGGSGGPRAFRWIPNGSAGNFVFEGLHVQDYNTAFLVGASQPPYRGAIQNLTFRNNVVNGSQGENAVYVSGVNGLKTFEGNTFYDNAYWDNHNEGAFRGKHIYFDNENGYAPNDPTGHAIFKDNFFIDSAAYAFQARTGGEIVNNYVESHGTGINVGGHDGGQTWPIVTASVHDNVVLHLGDSLHQTLGYGISFENADADVERNIIAYYESAKPFGHPFYVRGDAGNTAKTRLRNNTVYNTTGDIRSSGSLDPIVLTDNLVNNDMADDMGALLTNVRSSTVHFVDPDLRDVAKYNMEVLGGARDRDAFMEEALKQWRGNYRQEYTVTEVNNYIRKGFEPDGTQPAWCGKGAVPCGFAASLVAAGDFDNDQDVDGSDFLKWQRGESPIAIGQLDLSQWMAHFGVTGGAVVAAQAKAIPEPSTSLLMITAMLFFAFQGNP